MQKISRQLLSDLIYLYTKSTELKEIYGTEEDFILTPLLRIAHTNQPFILYDTSEDEIWFRTDKTSETFYKDSPIFNYIFDVTGEYNYE